MLPIRVSVRSLSTMPVSLHPWAAINQALKNVEAFNHGMPLSMALKAQTQKGQLK